MITKLSCIAHITRKNCSSQILPKNWLKFVYKRKRHSLTFFVYSSMSMSICTARIHSTFWETSSVSDDGDHTGLHFLVSFECDVILSYYPEVGGVGEKFTAQTGALTRKPSTPGPASEKLTHVFVLLWFCQRSFRAEKLEKSGKITKYFPVTKKLGNIHYSSTNDNNNKIIDCFFKAHFPQNKV